MSEAASTWTSVHSIEQLRQVFARFPPRTLGALVFPGFGALDLWGPLEVFGDSAPAVRLLLVGGDLEPVPSAQGPRVAADVTLDTAPRFDLLLIPGGQVEAQKLDRELLTWIRDRAVDAEVVMTVCNGADLLAETGVLDGRRATTNKGLFRSIAAAHPAVAWVPQARWVEDGRYVTSSGVTAGIDMALAVVAHLAGPILADRLAVHIEYDRPRNPDFDPFAALHRLTPRADGTQSPETGAAGHDVPLPHGPN